METAIQLFSNSAFGSIRVAKTDNGEPIFCLADLCSALQLSNNRKVKSQLDDDVTLSYPIIDSLGRNQAATFVTEPGMYTVILRSDSPLAKPIQKWVTSEVLPAIRRTGGYIAATAGDTPETIMARAILIANETMARQKSQLEAQAPKVLFASAVETSNRSCLVAELAKILNQNGVNIGQNRLFTWLRDHGYLGSKGEYYNQPTQRAMDMSLFEIKKTSITKPDGVVLVTSTPKITGHGQIYFVNKFLKRAISEAN